MRGPRKEGGGMEGGDRNGKERPEDGGGRQMSRRLAEGVKREVREGRSEEGKKERRKEDNSLSGARRVRFRRLWRRLVNDVQNDPCAREGGSNIDK